VADEDRAVCHQLRALETSTPQLWMCCREEDLDSVSVISGGGSRVTPAWLKKFVRHVPVDIFDDSPGSSIIVTFFLDYVEQIGNSNPKKVRSLRDIRHATSARVPDRLYQIAEPGTKQGDAVQLPCEVYPPFTPGMDVVDFWP
jgi:hypothetical protein